MATAESKIRSNGEPRTNASLCVAAALRGDDAEFERRLDIAVEMTCNNADALLCSDGSDKTLGIIKTDLPPDVFTHVVTEPLALLTNVAPRIHKGRRVHHAYLRYIEHLMLLTPTQDEMLEILIDDARKTAEDLLAYSIDEIYPTYPLDFHTSNDFKELLAKHPDLPVVVFAGPEGTRGAYCEIEGAEVVELLNSSCAYYSLATVPRSREEFAHEVESEMRECYSDSMRGKGLSDEQVEAAVKEKAASVVAEHDANWIPAIALHVSWKEL